MTRSLKVHNRQPNSAMSVRNVHKCQAGRDQKRLSSSKSVSQSKHSNASIHFVMPTRTAHEQIEICSHERYQ